VSRNSEHPDAAWDFLIFLTSKKSLQFYFEKTHKPTSRRDMISEQSKDPNYGTFAQQIGYAESFPIVDYNGYKKIFSDVLMSAYQGGSGIKGTLSDAQDQIDEMLPKDGYVNKEKPIDLSKDSSKSE